MKESKRRSGENWRQAMRQTATREMFAAACLGNSVEKRKSWNDRCQTNTLLITLPLSTPNNQSLGHFVLCLGLYHQSSVTEDTNYHTSSPLRVQVFLSGTPCKNNAPPLSETASDIMATAAMPTASLLRSASPRWPCARWSSMPLATS